MDQRLSNISGGRLQGILWLPTKRTGGTLCVERGHQNYVLYSDEEKDKLSEIIKKEEVIWSTDCLFFEHRNMQHAGGEWEGNHGCLYHLYHIPEDVDLRDRVPFTYEN